MQVSEVRLNLLKTDNAVKAIGSFALDGAFAVRGVRVMEDKNGRNFVAFPSREKADGSYEDIAFPIIIAIVHMTKNSVFLHLYKSYQKID